MSTRPLLLTSRLVPRWRLIATLIRLSASLIRLVPRWRRPLSKCCDQPRWGQRSWAPMSSGRRRAVARSRGRARGASQVHVARARLQLHVARARLQARRASTQASGATTARSPPHKATCHKATYHKATCHKATYHKATCHKATNHKATCHKATCTRRPHGTPRPHGTRRPMVCMHPDGRAYTAAPRRNLRWVGSTHQYHQRHQCHQRTLEASRVVFSRRPRRRPLTRTLRSAAGGGWARAHRRAARARSEMARARSEMGLSREAARACLPVRAEGHLQTSVGAPSRAPPSLPRAVGAYARQTSHMPPSHTPPPCLAPVAAPVAARWREMQRPSSARTRLAPCRHW